MPRSSADCGQWAIRDKPIAPASPCSERRVRLKAIARAVTRGQLALHVRSAFLRHPNRAGYSNGAQHRCCRAPDPSASRRKNRGMPFSKTSPRGDSSGASSATTRPSDTRSFSSPPVPCSRRSGRASASAPFLEAMSEGQGVDHQADCSAVSSSGTASISLRRGSRKGGSFNSRPNNSTASSTAKPGLSVAISNRMPPGSRK